MEGRMNRHTAQLRPKASEQQLTTDTGIPLTFGIEVECYVVRDLNVMSAVSDVQSYLCTLFSDACLPSVDCNDPNFERLLYQTWVVTLDSSLHSDFLDTDLISQMPHLKHPVTMAKFEIRGIELVSRPMPVPSTTSGTIPAKQPQMQEIAKYLNVLSGVHEPRPPHAAFTDDTCGLHIHLGRPGGESLPLDVLRHLAYLIFLYEPLLSTLHPYYRRPYPYLPGHFYCDSNLTAFQTDHHTCHRFRNCLISLDQVRRRIFDPACGLDGLAWLMGAPGPLDDKGHEKMPETDCDRCHQTGLCMNDRQVCLESCLIDNQGSSRDCFANQTQGYNHGIPDRCKIVNWQCLTRSDRPNTLEFRQAAGTLDPDEIAWTAQLYTALVREAERRSNSGLCEFSFSEEAFPNDLTMFLSMLHLSAEAIMYWTRRQARLQNEAAMLGWREDSLTPPQVCQQCESEAAAPALGEHGWSDSQNVSDSQQDVNGWIVCEQQQPERLA